MDEYIKLEIFSYVKNKTIIGLKLLIMIDL